MGIHTGGENYVSNLTKHCGLRPDQALSLCAGTLDNLTGGWNVVDQCTALTGYDTSDVEIASLPGGRVIAPPSASTISCLAAGCPTASCEA